MINRKFITTLVLLILLYSTGQAKAPLSFYNEIREYDLANVFNPDSITDDGNEKYAHQDPLGFIGDDYQRFQIHFTSFSRSKDNPYIYLVSGKTKIKNTICDFKGTIKVVAAEFDTSTLMKDIGFPNYKQGFVTGLIQLNENKDQPGSGFIKGQLITDCYFDDNGKIHYNALMLVADGFSNNQFRGFWTSYKTGVSKKCNWGDGRIPDSEDLDGGTGEFIPREKYIDNGWRNYYNCMGSFDDSITKKAIKMENINWWND